MNNWEHIDDKIEGGFMLSLQNGNSGRDLQKTGQFQKLFERSLFYSTGLHCLIAIENGIPKWFQREWSI